MHFTTPVALAAALTLASDALASHPLAQHARAHRNSLHRRQIRRVVRDCTGAAKEADAVSAAISLGYNPSNWAHQPSVTASSAVATSSTAGSVYSAPPALPKNALFATSELDDASDASDMDASNSTSTGADDASDVFEIIVETINIITSSVDNSTIAYRNDTIDSSVNITTGDDGYNGGVFMASDYDISLDGAAPVVRARRLSSHRQRAATCTHGDWRCTDMDLERCIWGTWTLIRACSGANIVCSDAPLTTGCVWTWNVQPQAVPTQAEVATTGSSRPQSASLPLTTTTTISTTFTASLPTTTPLINAEPTRVDPTLTSTPAPGKTGTSEKVEDDEEEDCEEWQDEPSSSAFTPTGTLPIGNGFFANVTVSSSHRSEAAPTRSASASTHGTVSVIDSGHAGPSVTDSASATPFPTDVQVTQSASGAFLSNLTNPSKTLSIIDASTISLSTASLTASATQGVITGSPVGVATYSAPHYVIYSDMWLSQMPSVNDLKEFNRFILAFWLSDLGPVDMWMGMSESDRQTVLDQYHAAGIALMVSAFGSTDLPTTNGKDPITTAQSLAKFVIAYGFDGVDIDYEDMGAMNSNAAEAWLVSFHRELRNLLPEPYLISHAPVAPWFTSAAVYQSGAYVAVHQAVGDSIDFYNVQFYNQGDGVYEDCYSLITQSGGYWPGTSVMEINSYANVPLNKIVIGKPLDAGKASNGYTHPSLLHQCVYQARQQGWNGGIMFWEWTSAAPGIMATARG